MKRTTQLIGVLLSSIMIMIPYAEASVKQVYPIGLGDNSNKVKVSKRYFNVDPVTSLYNREIKAHVLHFQKRTDLRNTGKIDKPTYTKISRRWERKKENRTEAYHRIVRGAKNQIGDPYVYGADGPNSFDCSGLTSFVYSKATGINLAHHASTQYGQSDRISKKHARPGDLVFFHNSSGIYHTAIFIGDNKIIHASTPGTNVTRARIWTSSVYYARAFNRFIPR